MTGVVQLVIAAIGSSAITGFLVSLLRWKPDTATILVTAAQGAVVIQSGVIDDLNEQITDMRQRIEECERQKDEMRRLRDEVAGLHETVDRLSTDLQRVTLERDWARRENQQLRDRVRVLETEVESLKQNGGAS